MYSVRIDKDGEGYVFKVQPIDPGLEMVSLDSAPGIIAMVQARNPGEASARAWEMALNMRTNRAVHPLSASALDDFIDNLLPQPKEAP